MRVAVTGATGRLGGALLAALRDAPFTGPRGPLAWSRPDYDLDDPQAAARLVARDAPEVVIHAAAWTDVDGSARDPERATRRNAIAVAELAAACVAAGSDLVLVSTNEVFDGRRTDRLGYTPADHPAPGNPYATAKLAGETAAQAAFLRAGGVIDARAASASATGPQLAVVRTAWLFGPPGNDFPAKILAAADRAKAAREPLRVVGDEWGTPTFASDLAGAIVDLLAEGSFAGMHHVVNAGVVTRAAWARDVLARAGIEVEIAEIAASTWMRPSRPPRWGVLEATPLPAGQLRPWTEAMAEYAPMLLRGRVPARPR